VKRPDIAVVGGGLLGRCLSWRASRAGARVALYDTGGSSGEASAAWVAAGMIAPEAEATDANPEIVAMGRHSLTLWPQWLAQLPVPVFYRDSGTLLLWHREDAGEVLRVEQTRALRHGQGKLRHVNHTELDEMEPALCSRFRQALYLPGEAQVDNRGLLKGVAMALEEAGAECHWNTFVADGKLPDAGVVVDCRGMGVRSDWRGLRGVRSEIVRLHAPEIGLQHMLRLLHPRFAVYVVPSSEGMLVVGATTVESDERSPVSVRGALELLSSAYSILPALAEARILEFATQVRPALPDNLPAFEYDRDRSILRINGLYRHGFLLLPTIVEEALALLSLQTRTNFPGQWSCLRENSSGGSLDRGHEGQELSTCSSS
jgi:glycine oxidase